MSGTATFGNIADKFKRGDFEIKERVFADSVAMIYMAFCSQPVKLNPKRLLDAIIAACRVAEFDPKRLIEGLPQCPGKLRNYSTRDEFLEMLEEIYNHRRQKLLALKISAIQAMRSRSIIAPKAES